MNQGAHFGIRSRGASGFTLIELIVSVTIISLLSLAALPCFRRIQVQAKVSASRNNQRVLTDAIEIYQVDYGIYPLARPCQADSFGIVSQSALSGLTTPIAYVQSDAFSDPFGDLRVQTPVRSSASDMSSDPYRLPRPGFNSDGSLFYFHYPRMAALMRLPVMNRQAYSVVSVGPDLKDSFAMYYPFPEALPARSALFGVESVHDTVYDPTNGTISDGDLAAFGGNLTVPRFLGGGQ